MARVAPETSGTATLMVDGVTIELPIVEGTEGERAIDVSRLREATGLITLDPGFGNTGSCVSGITFIDGEQGILRHRGYSLAELAEQSTFLEAAYLVLRGELPTQDQLTDFEQKINGHTALHEDIRQMYRAFPQGAHPMAITSALVGALSTFYQDSLDPLDKSQVEISTYRLLGKLPTICAGAYKYSVGHSFNDPRNDLSYSENMLQMMFATPTENYDINPIFARALETLLILHVDHEQNCSSSTMRIVGSSHANIYASASAAINALWGPRHGGANQAVVEMLHDIAGEEVSGTMFLERCKSRDDTTRLMGFGHRVYKTYDPRANILKKMTTDVLEELGSPTRLLEIAMEIEEMALRDDYFVSRNLYPNVDFYSGIIYEALGFPTDMFTVFFALGRMPGWIAQWVEQHDDPAERIGRPRQVYVGKNERSYVPIDQR